MTDHAGCSTKVVFTGQTASCNGSAKARATRTVTVPPAIAAGTLAARTLVTLRLATRRTPARGPLKVTVSNGNRFAVTGRLSGRTTKKVATSPRRRIALKAKAFEVNANAEKTIRLTLPKALRRLLGRNRKLSLQLTAKVADPAGHTRTVTTTVTSRLKKQR